MEFYGCYVISLNSSLSDLFSEAELLASNNETSNSKVIQINNLNDYKFVLITIMSNNVILASSFIPISLFRTVDRIACERSEYGSTDVYYSQCKYISDTSINLWISNAKLSYMAKLYGIK